MRRATGDDQPLGIAVAWRRDVARHQIRQRDAVYVQPGSGQGVCNRHHRLGKPVGPPERLGIEAEALSCVDHPLRDLGVDAFRREIGGVERAEVDGFAASDNRSQGAAEGRGRCHGRRHPGGRDQPQPLGRVAGEALGWKVVRGRSRHRRLGEVGEQAEIVEEGRPAEHRSGGTVSL